MDLLSGVTFTMKPIRHETATVESACIGDDTRILAYAHIYPKGVVGSECVIGDHVVIEDGAVIGNRVTIGSGVCICGGVNIEDDVVVGSNVAFNDELLPHGAGGKEAQPDRLGQTLESFVRKGARIGANASILRGLTIGQGAMIGPGTVIAQDVPSNAVVRGNPARIIGYVNVLNVPHESLSLSGTEKELPTLRTKGAKLHRLPLIRDLRGALTFGEIDKQLPFTPKRFFVVHDVPSEESRGEHAHKELHEFIVCLKGSCSMMLDDGEHRDEIVLDTPTIGLHVPPKVWRVHYKYSANAVTLVLASEIYKAEDYIRSYEQFKEYIGKR